MENVRTSLNGYRLDAELKNVPVSFVNGLRRILLAEIPTVVVSNVQILENSSSMTHEMVRHRTEMLPVNVRAEEVAVVRDTKLELRVVADKEPREVTTDDFVATGPRGDILLKDRDLGTPLLFMVLKPGEAIHIKANLVIQSTKTSQVCVSTFKNHIDPDVVKVDRDTFVSQAGDDPAAQREAARIFDAFHIQRCFHRNKESGRPDWFDLTVESIGTTPARDLVKKAAEILLEKVNEFVKLPILREDEGWFRVEVPGETHTLGALVQEMVYLANTTEFVSMDIGHPLVPKLVIRFNSKTGNPEDVIKRFQTEASALCENVLSTV
jgi:DNA-directed RNA polymerase alpha subunit